MFRQLALAGTIVAVMTVGVARGASTPSCPVPCDGVCRPRAQEPKAVGARSRNPVRSRHTASRVPRNPAGGARPAPSSAVASRVAPAPSAFTAVAPEGMRVAWDPETRTWGAPSRPSSAMADPERIGGLELPFRAPVEFDLPGGGHGIYLGSRDLDYFVATRGRDGKFQFGCVQDTSWLVAPTRAVGR